MGKCKYCGQDAGLLSHKHDECEQKHEKGVKETQELMFSFQEKILKEKGV